MWFTWQDVLVLVVTLALYGAVWLFANRTRFGAVIRAVAEDPKLAQLFGINAKVVYLRVFVFECAAVALGAALVAPRAPILTSMGFNEVIMTFVVVVLGGIGSIGGALLAGLGLGLFTAFFGAFVAPAYTTAAAFACCLRCWSSGRQDWPRNDRTETQPPADADAARGRDRGAGRRRLLPAAAARRHARSPIRR